MSTKSKSTTVPSTTTAKPAKKKAKLPAVIDRAGVVEMPSPDTPDPSDGDTTATPAPSASDAASATASSSAPVSPPAAASAPAADPTAIGTPPGALPALMSGPPSVTVPVPPSGFVPVRAIDLRGYRPMQSELASVPDAILELGQVPNWGPIFGITAPAATSVAQRLQVGAQWTALRAQSDSWSSYVNSQEGMAWKDALEVLNSLKPAFALATAASPSMLSAYPALTRLLGAQKVVAKRAVATRKKNAAAASAAPATTPAAAPAPAATDASATPARVVTVTG